jgi:hypothetical protein
MDRTMTKFSEESCSKTLVDVRKACRLIFLYQRRVFTICQEISDKLNYWRYYSDTTIGQGYDPEVKDFFVPTFRRMYLPPNKSNNACKGDHMLELISVVDDSFDDFINMKSAVSPGKSNSYMVFRIYLNHVEQERNWYYNISKIYHNQFWEYDKRIESNDRTVSAFCQRFDFCRLYEPLMIEKALKLFQENVLREVSVQLGTN